MRKRKSDHELAEEIANRLANTPSGGRGPAADAQILLQYAANAGGGGLRQQYLEQAQRELSKLDSARYRNTIQRLQSQIMALQGRHGDTKVAHVARGELVVPTALQNPEVLWALRRAAAPYNIPLEMLSVGNAMNRINPNTGAPEFGIMDWISGLFGDTSSQPSQQDSDNSLTQGAVDGVIARAATTGINSANARADYIDQTRSLNPQDPLDNARRSEIKAQVRDATPPEVRAIIQKLRPDLGPREGSVGRANVTNPMADQIGRGLGVAGKGLLGANLALSAADIVTSDNPTRTAVANAGAFGGGLLGGVGGAAVGGLMGPAAFATVPAGAVVGSGLGGAAGYKIGEGAYDYIHNLWNKY
jgi:hypothetical protein